jgi:putative flippase GtrA
MPLPTGWLKSRLNLTRSAMQFFWYIVAGGLATAVHYAVLIALVESSSLTAAPAAAIGALSGAAVAYLLNRRKTFAGSSVDHAHALPRFMAIALLGAILNGALVWLGIQQFGWHYLVAQMLATVLVLVLTFRLNRLWTFAQ